MPTRPSAPQRSSLRFCKAFFEIADRDATLAALTEAGAQSLQEESADEGEEIWYWWSPGEAVGDDAFLIRLRAARLVLEGATAATVGRGWRTLDRLLQPHARARVAAGDALDRFLPRAPRQAGDRPETWSPDHEARVLAEFYAAFSTRWANRPHPRLDGMTPLQAACRHDLVERLEEVLQRLEQIEAERRDRGLASFAVADLRGALLGAALDGQR